MATGPKPLSEAERRHRDLAAGFEATKRRVRESGSKEAIVWLERQEQAAKDGTFRNLPPLEEWVKEQRQRIQGKTRRKK